MDTYKHNCHFVLVLGPPAAGKTTLCEKLVNDPDFAHLNLYQLPVNDYIRARQADGTLPPTFHSLLLAGDGVLAARVLMPLLEEKMAREYENSGARCFILDGFPVTQNQMDAFNRKFHNQTLVGISIECDKAIAHHRFATRAFGRSAGATGNSFEQLYTTFQAYTAPLIPIFEAAWRLIKVDNTIASYSNAGEEAYHTMKQLLMEHNVAGRVFRAV